MLTDAMGLLLDECSISFIVDEQTCVHAFAALETKSSIPHPVLDDGSLSYFVQLPHPLQDSMPEDSKLNL